MSIHDEKWHVDGERVVVTYPDGTWQDVLFAEGPEERSHLPTLEERNAARDLDAARARLAAQAPAMARLLVRLSFVRCPICDAHENDPCNTLTTGHHAGCELGDVLDAAGVLDWPADFDGIIREPKP